MKLRGYHKPGDCEKSTQPPPARRTLYGTIALLLGIERSESESTTECSDAADTMARKNRSDKQTSREQTQTQHTQQGSCIENSFLAPPPKYEAVVQGSSFVTKAPQTPAEQPKRGTDCIPEWHRQPPTIRFVYSNRHSTHGDPERTWMAILRVSTSDPVRLMREGFYWSVANASRIDSSFRKLNPATAQDVKYLDWGYKVSCRCFLSDLGPDPQWFATLDVWARTNSVLSGFKLKNLSTHNTYQASSVNSLRQRIYEYSFLRPLENISLIFGETPLEGAWPWPRADDGWVPPSYHPEVKQ